MRKLQISTLIVLIAVTLLPEMTSAQNQMNHVDIRIGTDARQKEFTLSVVEKPKVHVHLDFATSEGEQEEVNLDKEIGKPYNKCWIHHDGIMNGGVLELTMSSKPNRKWGIEK